MTDLLPCPFCGKPAKVFGSNLVGCEDQIACGANVDWDHYTKGTGPANAWNTRSAATLAAALALPEIAALVEAATAALDSLLFASVELRHAKCVPTEDCDMIDDRFERIKVSLAAIEVKK